MTIHRLQLYIAVATHLHVSRAARQLHISQSALSHELKLLQDDYGAVFIKRKSKGIELTPAGIEFHRDVTLILEKLKGLRQKFGNAGSPPVSKS